MNNTPDYDRLRCEAEINCAKWLIKGRKTAPANWTKGLESASALLAEGAPRAEVEAALAPFAREAKRHTLYCAGHAHIDMNWMWSWPETVNVTLDTFRTVLALLEEFPQFHFSQSQASVYDIVRQYEPDMLPLIAKYVHEGRWEVTASHWVENDANLSGPESLVHHLLQTRAFMKELFGLAPEDVAIDWAPDTFGFAATTPTYLRQGGVRHVYLHRPGTMHQPVPEAFWWEGPDGARVLVHNAQRRGYNMAVDANAALETLGAMRDCCGLPFALAVYGVGDHGGGPTRRDLLRILALDALPVFPNLRMAPAREFFERLEREAPASLPVIRDELGFELTGCYTSQSIIKRDNRVGEARLLEAEAAAAFAAAVDRGRSARLAASLAPAWRRQIFSQFHDILPGSCVRDTRSYAHGTFQEAMAVTSTATAQACRALAAQIDTRPKALEAYLATNDRPPEYGDIDSIGSGSGIDAHEGSFGIAAGPAHGGGPLRSFVLFNTLATARREVVSLTLWDRNVFNTADRFRAMRFEALDANGSPLPTQFLGVSSRWGHARQDYAVEVAVPACGYTTIHFREASGDLPAPPPAAAVRILPRPHHCGYIPPESPEFALENDQILARFNSQTGRLVSLIDVASGDELLNTEVGVGPEFATERPHGMTAWNIGPTDVPSIPRVVDMKKSVEGPVTSAVEVVYAVGSRSTARFTYRLDTHSRAIRVNAEVDWTEVGSPQTGVPNLRLVVGSAFRMADTAAYEIPFGHIVRDVECQNVPAQRWACLADPDGGAALLVANDSKYGHELHDGALRVNLLRSSYDPDPFPEQGRHTMAFSIEAFDGAPGASVLTAAAQRLEQPVRAVAAATKHGPLPAESSFVDVTGEGVNATCVKRADDGSDAIVVRLVNQLDRAADAEVVLCADLGSLEGAAAVDLLERPVAGAKVSVSGALAKVTLPPRGLATLRLAFKPAAGK